MSEKLRISFEGKVEDLNPQVVIYNADVLTPGLFRQIKRFGLSKRLDSRALFSGRLKGTRKGLLAMVESYGGIEIVRAA